MVGPSQTASSLYRVVSSTVSRPFCSPPDAAAFCDPLRTNVIGSWTATAAAEAGVSSALLYSAEPSCSSKPSVLWCHTYTAVTASPIACQSSRELASVAIPTRGRLSLLPSVGLQESKSTFKPLITEIDRAYE